MDSKKWARGFFDHKVNRETSKTSDDEIQAVLKSPNGFELAKCGGAVVRLSECYFERFNEFSNTKINLRGHWPPICEMESLASIPLELISGCHIFSVSKNMIERINGLKIFDQLRVLSLAQNQIKSLSGLECLSNTLEELIIAWNMISELDALPLMKKLKFLDISFNHVREFTEYSKLKYCPSLTQLIFKGNPVCNDYSPDVWRDIAIRKLKYLSVLDEVVARKSILKKIPSVKKKSTSKK